MTEGTVSRYPGPRPFQDVDIERAIFKGRDTEIAALWNRILANTLVVVYAKSGAGKTSLLKAGISDHLRSNGCLPVFIRLNDVERELARSVELAVKDTAGRSSVDCSVSDESSLAGFFKTLKLWRGIRLLTPVLMLDQFEELFTKQSSERRDNFIRELAELVHAAAIPGGTPVKIVISIREDHLTRLERLAVEIPQVFHDRFKLDLLAPEGAWRAIEEPAVLEDPKFQTRPFSFTAGTVEQIVRFLCRSGPASGPSTMAAGSSDEEIEPFQLQVICVEAERIALLKQHAAPKQPSAIDYKNDLHGDAGLRRLLASFYEERLRALPKPHSRRALHRFFERGLIENGTRRMLEAGEITRTYGLPPGTLEELANSHLIRSEPRGSRLFYEISHDTLVAPIMQSRRNRRNRMLRSSAGAAVPAILLLALAFFLTVNSDWYQASKSSTRGSELVQKMALSNEGHEDVLFWNLASALYGSEPEWDFKYTTDSSLVAQTWLHVARIFQTKGQDPAKAFQAAQSLAAQAKAVDPYQTALIWAYIAIASEDRRDASLKTMQESAQKLDTNARVQVYAKLAHLFTDNDLPDLALESLQQAIASAKDAPYTVVGSNDLKAMSSVGVYLERKGRWIFDPGSLQIELGIESRTSKNALLFAYAASEFSRAPDIKDASTRAQQSFETALEQLGLVEPEKLRQGKILDAVQSRLEQLKLTETTFTEINIAFKSLSQLAGEDLADSPELAARTWKLAAIPARKLYAPFPQLGNEKALPVVVVGLAQAGKLDEALETIKDLSEVDRLLALIDIADFLYLQPGREAQFENVLNRWESYATGPVPIRVKLQRIVRSGQLDQVESLEETRADPQVLDSSSLLLLKIEALVRTTNDRPFERLKLAERLAEKLPDDQNPWESFRMIGVEYARRGYLREARAVAEKCHREPEELSILSEVLLSYVAVRWPESSRDVAASREFLIQLRPCLQAGSACKKF